MIVYAGKQFWNDFNNGDEALFQDANRPRDNDKFKIKPWLQSDKWDWRWSNKNISTFASQLVAKGLNKISTASTLNPDDYVRPSLKETYTLSDLSNFVGYVTAAWVTFDNSILSEYATILNQEKYGNPWCKIKDWNIQITQSWTYIIQAFAQFMFPYGYSPSNSYQYKEYVALLQLTDDGWIILNKNQWRACSTDDQLLTRQAWWFKAWDILNVWAAHTYWNQVSVNEVINLQRLA